MRLDCKLVALGRELDMLAGCGAPQGVAGVVLLGCRQGVEVEREVMRRGRERGWQRIVLFGKNRSIVVV